MPEQAWNQTFCILCYVNCGIEVAIENGRMRRDSCERRVFSGHVHLVHDAVVAAQARTLLLNGVAVGCLAQFIDFLP